MNIFRVDFFLFVIFCLQIPNAYSQISQEEARKRCEKNCPEGHECTLIFGKCRVCSTVVNQCTYKSLKLNGIDATPNTTTSPKLTGKKGPASLSGVVDFDYSTFNGQIIVGNGERRFVLSFSKCSNDCIYVMTSGHKNCSNIKRMARIKKASANKKIRLGDYDSTSSIYQVLTNEYAILENTNGYYLFLQIRKIQDDGRGYNEDKIVLKYKINSDQSSSFYVSDLK